MVIYMFITTVDRLLDTGYTILQTFNSKRLARGKNEKKFNPPPNSFFSTHL